MAFSYDPDGGIAVARILSDHPEDNGKLVYLHKSYEPALDDEWIEQGHYPYPAAVPAAHAQAQALAQAQSQAKFKEQVAQAAAAANAAAPQPQPQPQQPEPQQSQRGKRPGSHAHGNGRPRKRPRTSAGAAPTSFTTQETPDTEFPFPVPASGASNGSSSGSSSSSSGAGHAGRPLLRGGALGDEDAPAGAGAGAGPAAGAAGGAAPDVPAQLAGAALPPRSILKRPRIAFDPAPPRDEDGRPVERRAKSRRTEASAGGKDAKQEPAGLGFPPPPKDPDAMSDAEFDAYVAALAPAAREAFFDYLSDLDGSSSGDDDDSVYSDDEDGLDRKHVGPAIQKQSDVLWVSETLPRPAIQKQSDVLWVPAAWSETLPKKPPPKPIATDPGVRGAGGAPSTNPVDLLGADYFQTGSRERGQIKEAELKQIYAQMAYGPRHQPAYQGPKADTLKKVHEEAIRDAERRQMGKEIELFGGDCFRLVPSWPKRECIFIVGQQGAGAECVSCLEKALAACACGVVRSTGPITREDVLGFDFCWCEGKSWFTGRYIREWKKQHPDGKVVVFSQVATDKELDKCGITRVMIDDGLVENPYEIKELANCLCVFDDIDAIRDKKIKKAVTDLCDELQVIGRHENTWVIRTSHLFRNWGTTRASLAESNKTVLLACPACFLSTGLFGSVFFPQLGSSYGIRSWLKTHVGLDPKKIERMFKVRSRWVVLDQHAPNWCLSEHLLYVV